MCAQSCNRGQLFETLWTVAHQAPVSMEFFRQEYWSRWRTVWRFLKKLEIKLPYNPAIPLLGMLTEETRIERDTCTPMFIAALFTIARTWKQASCPSVDEWIRKLWYIYTIQWNITQLLKRMHLNQF